MTIARPGTACLLAAAIGLATPVAAAAQALRPGTWDVTSKLASLSVPGAPGFLLRMARGRSTSEHKRLAPDQGIEALLAPAPKAGCTIDSQTIAAGRYTQALTCPRKKDGPAQILRTGSWNASGFAGRAVVTAASPKGQVRIELDQKAARVGD